MNGSCRAPAANGGGILLNQLCANRDAFFGRRNGFASSHEFILRYSLCFSTQGNASFRTESWRSVIRRHVPS